MSKVRQGSPSPASGEGWAKRTGVPSAKSCRVQKAAKVV